MRSIIINTATPIDLATFTIADITLNFNDSPLDLSEAGVSIVLTGPGYALNAVRILLPAGLTTPAGNYELIVTGAGITTTHGPAFTNVVTSLWTKI